MEMTHSNFYIIIIIIIILAIIRVSRTRCVMQY